jgi:putative transposase/transposase-like zinc-binding protein
MQPHDTGAAGGSGLTLAEVLRAGMPAYAAAHRLPPSDWKTVRAIIVCRTPQLGGHLYQCRHCGQEHFVPHSCRNRHCPTCQGVNGFDWLAKQAELLLPIPYFHLVFTLPHGLNPLIQQNRARLYDLLFASASATLLEFGRNHLHAQIGLTAVLHTWSQTLLDHYHLHCIATGGGLRVETCTWAKAAKHWLFPVRALSVLFRAKFRDGLRQLYQSGQLEFHGQLQRWADPIRFQQMLCRVCRDQWVVYAKRPFAGPEAVLAYLSRYTHRVGITNRRLLALEAQTVSFEYKDYADGSRRKTLTLSLEEFIRRFRLHILPERFVKIRHYGLLANRNRHTRIAQARAALNAPLRSSPQLDGTPASQTTDSSTLLICPHCRQPGLILIRITRPATHMVPGYTDSS